MKRIIHTTHAPKAVGPYSQATEQNGMLFISGQVPVNPANGEIPESITEQTTQVLENIQAIIEEAGYTMKNIVKCTCLLDDMDNFKAMNEVYATYFPTEPPARAAFGVVKLPLGVKVEIEAIAMK